MVEIGVDGTYILCGILTKDIKNNKSICITHRKFPKHCLKCENRIFVVEKYYAGNHNNYICDYEFDDICPEIEKTVAD